MESVGNEHVTNPVEVVPNSIVFFTYSASPYGKQVYQYLQLRGLPFAVCPQPAVLPRPDVAALGVKYRRIPLLAIGSDVYCDTRLILRKLEEIFPEGKLGSNEGWEQAIEKLLDKWTTDAGVFARAAQLIPPNAPPLKDPNFLKDRSSFSGRAWSAEQQEKGRPEATVAMRDAFDILESTLLADERDWLLKTKKPTLADVKGVWPFQWMLSLPGALDSKFISAATHPKTFKWIERFTAAVKATKFKPATIKGPEAVQHITNASLTEKEGRVDEHDPLKLKQGAEVEVRPTDSGFGVGPDSGRLINLTASQVTIACKMQDGGKEVHVHFPRWGFRVQAKAQAPKL